MSNSSRLNWNKTSVDVREKCRTIWRTSDSPPAFTVNENRIFFIVYKNKFNEIFFQTMKSASLIKSIWMENFEKFFFIGIKPFGLCIDSVSSNLLCFVKCQVLKYSKMLSTESTTTCIVFFHQI